MARVLVIDDDRALLQALREVLSRRGHEVIIAATGDEGLTKVAIDLPELIILDLGLPDLDGLEVCHRVRQWSDVPVIVLSATGLERRKVAALDGGANDYVTKPFGFAELEARIRTALRNHRAGEAPQTNQLVVGELAFDFAHHQVARNGVPIGLTAKEFDLLAYLARHAEKLCTHEMLVRSVWGEGYGFGNESLRVYIFRLRRKLGDLDGRLLRTSSGLGYSLSAD